MPSADVHRRATLRIIRGSGERRHVIRSSCSTRSTRLEWTGAVIPPPRCWRCWIPAQNHTFVDNYLAVSFDLSQVLFIATAKHTRHHPRAPA